MPDDPTSCLRWVVKTRDGYLGNRSGFSPGHGRARFQYARLFTREADAQRACGPGEVHLPVTVKLIPEFHSDG